MESLLRTSTLALLLLFAACTRAAVVAPPPEPVPATVQTPAVAVDTTTDPISQQEYAQRRAALARLVGNGIVVAFGSPEPAADFLTFAQNSNYRYLTGITEPESRLILDVRNGVPYGTLFVRERDFAREVWEGYRLGTERAAQLTGMRTRRHTDFPRVLDSVLTTAANVMIIEGGDIPTAYISPARQLTAELRGRAGITIGSANGLVAQLRGPKSPAELFTLRHAMRITVDGHRAAMATIAPGRYEFEVEAALEQAFRAAGAERPAFSTIVGSGPNSAVLHYNENNRRMEAGDVVVIDIGASWRGYAGDVTRTYPVSGRFTPEQREIYQIVRDAQAAAEAAATPGARAGAMYEAAERVLAEGLARVGLVEAADATYDCPPSTNPCQQFRLYYMHSLGHGIGLDVHDPGTAPNARSRDVPLSRGDVFSIEPGIYVRRHLLDVIPDTPRNTQLKERIRAAVARYGDIGVRIEDDYLVTENGVEWVTRAPREISELER
jgi:Xaa-Pro aminopeptidase